MQYVVIGIAAFLTSCLTLFSGFGLGTILMPVFAIFFPVEIAIALTAIVHFLNDFFKLTLLRKYARFPVIIRFGLPAVAAALLGAEMLIWVSRLNPLFEYSWANHNFSVMPVKLLVGVLIFSFALFEALPAASQITFDKKYLPIGGLLSGFFGGLSGNQGAFRSAFLVRSGLTKEEFIGTGAAIACLIDLSRISVYSVHFRTSGYEQNVKLLMVAVLSAFSGAWIGRHLLKKMTMHSVQLVVTFLLILIAVGLIFGFI